MLKKIRDESKIDILLMMNSILNPTVWVGSFEWREPVTTLTDFLVALVCWFAYFSFGKIVSKHVSFKWFKNYFLIFAIGMTSAAWLGHGLQAYVPDYAKVVGWICGATGLMFLQLGSFKIIENRVGLTVKIWLPKWFVFQWILAVLLMIFMLQYGIENAFKVTQINSSVALILMVLPMHLFASKKLNLTGSKIVASALFYSIIPGIVYSNQLSINHWFNYHDISHLLMAVFMTIMYFGLRRVIESQK
ncbi:MAG: hypothetical protein H6607_10850 [Flavobacteriales bacterium]|nr:hypothetical protein [Flavobacteriales bacterium]